MKGQNFRAGVVIVIRHPDLRRVLAFERADMIGSWQLPQGGLEAGEEPIEAAWREMHEETGLDATHVIARAEYPEWVAYEWPEDFIREQAAKNGRRGQVQRWFLFDAVNADIEPLPNGDEFVAWKWVFPEWLTSHVIEWRRPAYARVLGTL